jgi:hypothetical protein
MLLFDMMPEGDFKISWQYAYLSRVVEGEETYHYSHVSEYYYEKHCEAHGI